MSTNTRVLVRNAREQDITTVAEIDAEAFAPYGTVEKAETFQRRLTAFPNGFVILVAENEIAAYGCSEKWLTEREPGLDENPLVSHQPDGRIFCITAIAVRSKFQGRGYRLLVLDKLMEIAHNEGCRKIVLETTHAQDLYQKRGFQVIQHRTQRGASLGLTHYLQRGQALSQRLVGSGQGESRVSIRFLYPPSIVPISSLYALLFFPGVISCAAKRSWCSPARMSSLTPWFDGNIPQILMLWLYRSLSPLDSTNLLVFALIIIRGQDGCMERCPIRKGFLDQKEDAMFVVIKWISAGVLAAFTWLVTGYTLEYFRPYKRVAVRLRSKE